MIVVEHPANNFTVILRQNTFYCLPRCFVPELQSDLLLSPVYYNCSTNMSWRGGDISVKGTDQVMGLTFYSDGLCTRQTREINTLSRIFTVLAK